MPINYPEHISPPSKMRSPDRTLKLELIDGKKPINSTGMVDSRLFKDGDDKNRLHAIMDQQTNLWGLKYEKGAIPGGLEGQWTSFARCKSHAEDYFHTRNIKVVEVID